MITESGETECGHHGCTSDLRDHWMGLPNAVTVLRGIGTAVLCLIAAGAPTAWPWLLAALATYWLGDIADGLLARWRGTETRTGAVLDILTDRLSVCLIIAIYGTTEPGVLLPATVFLVQFVVVDAYLSLAFLGWPLLSPNYFHLVDTAVYRWNWSPPAKALNTGAVVAVWLLTHNPVATTAVAVLALSVKVASAVRLAARTPPAARRGCAGRESTDGARL